MLIARTMSAARMCNDVLVGAAIAAVLRLAASSTAAISGRATCSKATASLWSATVKSLAANSAAIRRST
jgi:hypothetical protein